MSAVAVNGLGVGVDTQAVTSRTFVAVPSTADVAAVRALSPLAAELRMRCGPFDVPVAVVASPASLEAESTQEAEIIRQFLEEDPWAGMGSVRAGGWMLLGRDANTIVIGQREGVVGLGKVVVLGRRDEAFVAHSMGGWRLSSAVPDEQAEASFIGTAHGSSVTVEWDCGRDMGGLVDRVVSRCQVMETEDEVHFLVWSIRNPAQASASSGFEVGTGASASVTIELSGPLGRRLLFNDFRVPAQRVDAGQKNQA